MGRARAQAINDLKVLRRVLTPRGFGNTYTDKDRFNRTACEVLDACCDQGASFPRGLITPIEGEEWVVPEGLDSRQFKRFLEFLLADKDEYKETKTGIGGRLLRPDPRKYAARVKKAQENNEPIPKEPAPTSIQIQLSSNKDLDRGAFDYLRAWVEAATARVRSGKFSAEDKEYGRIGSRFLRWWEELFLRERRDREERHWEMQCHREAMDRGLPLDRAQECRSETMYTHRRSLRGSRMDRYSSASSTR